MAIFLFRGDAKTGKSLLANALRNHMVMSNRGALLIDDTNNGETIPLIEKIIDGVPFRPELKLDQKWKADPVIILVGDKAAKLADFEELMPGFTEKFGPVHTVTFD